VLKYGIGKLAKGEANTQSMVARVQLPARENKKSDSPNDILQLRTSLRIAVQCIGEANDEGQKPRLLNIQSTISCIQEPQGCKSRYHEPQECNARQRDGMKDLGAQRIYLQQQIGRNHQGTQQHSNSGIGEEGRGARVARSDYRVSHTIVVHTARPE